MSAKEKNVDLAQWSGPKRPFDLLKGLAIALVPLTLLIVTCAFIFSSPDVRALTLEDWATAAPTDFVMTTTNELAGTTTSATYGAPYNKGSDGQVLGPLKIQRLFGVRIPINPANDFVVEPLKSSLLAGVYAGIGQWNNQSAGQQIDLARQYIAAMNADLSTALHQWTSASASQQIKWATWYKVALDKTGDPIKVAADPGYGPVPTMTSSLLALAQGGILDGILTTRASPYPSDFTKPLLFLADGTYMTAVARSQHFDGKGMGLVNETGSYPGQFWLLPATFFYQAEPFKSSKNGGAYVFLVRLLEVLALIYLPKIPVLNKIPRWIPVHRVIWHRYYKEHNL
jgi:hypothetical protein